MIDLHIHSLFSNGKLLPSEFARGLEDMDYYCVVITDHVDLSNLDFVASRLVTRYLLLVKPYKFNKH